MPSIKSAVKLLPILAISLLPALFLELILQYHYKNQLLNQAWAIPSFLRPKQVLPGSHLPHLNNVEDSPWVDVSGEQYVRTPVKFRTDAYGSIEPSSLENALRKDEPYVLFCGGSTTEAWASPEGERVTDVFSSISGTHAVNLAKSGKDLEGCLQTISKFFDLGAPNPQKIVISTSSNTFAAFAKSYAARNSLVSVLANESYGNGATDVFSPPLSVSGFLRSKLQSFVPGLYQFTLRLKMNSGKYAPMEYGLVEGCCYPASELNKRQSEITWLDSAPLEDYSRYMDKRIKSLVLMASLNNYPLSNLVIFVEPNSFGLNSVVGQHDYRQLLHDVSGNELGLISTKEVVDVYDQIYSNSFKQFGFRVLAVPDALLKDSYFYDAVHTTAIGSRFIGRFYAEQL